MPDPTPVPGAPHNTAPSHNRMIIAFPFSAVRISGSDEAVAALASIVAELADLVAKDAADADAQLLADRARSLARQIAGDSDA
jgi:hypothetical protein